MQAYETLVRSLIGLLSMAAASTAGADGGVVAFPEIVAVDAITVGPQDHFYASYYGINSWSADQRYATVLETDLQDRLPTENDPAILGLVDMETRKFLPLTETRAWNFQQGCMAH
ncbi:MAG: hypothetical protein AAF961_11920, partial [Planctomycetota bacterium]